MNKGCVQPLASYNLSRKMARLPLLTLLLFASTSTCHWWLSASFPLHTNSRWIVDDAGLRVKLACISWTAHLEPMLAEGLSKQPLDRISKLIGSMGFNCVRLTWPLFMVTDSTLSSLTVQQSFESLGLNESLAGIKVNNPAMVDIPLTQAFQMVVGSLGENNIMVILDNHISKPGWCCSKFDGNGFFGDKYFDPEVWLSGLASLAAMFNGSANVVGMSLRNELRGAKQNVKDWYRYMQRGAETVHAANPDVLIILSGLNFDRDLTFLNRQPINLTFTGKALFELHWYAFSDGKIWENRNLNQVCGSFMGSFKKSGGFLLDQGWPLFLGEFGVDQRGTNKNDNRFLSCILGLAAELDFEWALWTLPGSYYVRQGVVNMDETYGVLSYGWCGPRNATFLDRISALQSPIQGSKNNASDARPYQILYHPATGQCIVRESILGPLKLGPCTKSESWSYTAKDKTLSVKDEILCLQAAGSGKPAMLGILCSDSNSKWDSISDSKMHLSAKVAGNTVCLDVGAEGTIITSPCRCLSRDPSCDPTRQWFKIVNSTREKKINPRKYNWSLLLNVLQELRATGWLGFFSILYDNLGFHT